MKTVVFNNLLIAKYQYTSYHPEYWIIKNRIEPGNQVLYVYRGVEIFLPILVYNLNLKLKEMQKEKKEEERGIFW